MIKILVADDQLLFREGLTTLLSVNSEFSVVAEAGDGEQALRLAVQTQPDVVLMDLRMPVMDGVTTTQRLRYMLPECKVIVLTTFDEDKDIYEALRAGAVGYLLKDVTSEKLYEAIKAASKGEYFLHPTITARLVAEYSRIPHGDDQRIRIINPLSRRELEIMMLVAEGKSNKEIADYLVIAEGTVKNHLSNILSKLDVKDRLNAVVKAKEMGIIR